MASVAVTPLTFEVTKFQGADSDAVRNAINQTFDIPNDLITIILSYLIKFSPLQVNQKLEPLLIETPKGTIRPLRYHLERAFYLCVQEAVPFLMIVEAGQTKPKLLPTTMPESLRYGNLAVHGSHLYTLVVSNDQLTVLQYTIGEHQIEQARETQLTFFGSPLKTSSTSQEPILWIDYDEVHATLVIGTQDTCATLSEKDLAVTNWRCESRSWLKPIYWGLSRDDAQTFIVVDRQGIHLIAPTIFPKLVRPFSTVTVQIRDEVTLETHHVTKTDEGMVVGETLKIDGLLRPIFSYKNKKFGCSKVSFLTSLSHYDMNLFSSMTTDVGVAIIDVLACKSIDLYQTHEIRSTAPLPGYFTIHAYRNSLILMRHDTHFSTVDALYSLTL